MQNKKKKKTFYFIEVKCLLCSSRFQDQQRLSDHNATYHNVNQNTCFFKKLFVTDNKTFFKKCIRCDEFLITKKEKAKYDFIKHYDAGKEIRFKEKPLDVIQLPALAIYKIELKNTVNSILFTILKSVLTIF